MALSIKQARAFRDSTARINIWEGAVRSGKTISSLLRWLDYVRDAPDGGELAVIGKTTHTCYRNVFRPLMDPAVTGRVSKSIDYTAGAPTGTILGREIHVIGANDARAEAKIRGLTGAGAYVDEATVLPEDFWDQLVARQSTPGAKIFATTNPDSPAHWLRTKWLTNGNPSVRSWHFTLDDNPFLEPDYVAHLKRSYFGLWYRRFILGLWVAAEGAIYDALDFDRHVVTPGRIPPIVDWLAASIDYGTSNPFHAVLIGRGDDHRLYVTAEYRYNSRTAQRQLTDAKYSAAFRNFLATAPIPRTQLAGVRPRYVVVDPSAASFRVQLNEDGIASYLADNDVLDGIRTVSNVLGNDRLRISASCRFLIDEMSGYSWDPKAQKIGEDKPIKLDDHGPDALRYGLHTTRADWMRMLEQLPLAA